MPRGGVATDRLFELHKGGRRHTVGGQWVKPQTDPAWCCTPYYIQALALAVGRGARAPSGPRGLQFAPRTLFGSARRQPVGAGGRVGCGAARCDPLIPTGSRDPRTNREPSGARRRIPRKPRPPYGRKTQLCGPSARMAVRVSGYASCIRVLYASIRS